MMHTISCEYNATGEGLTCMILFTRAYPKSNHYNDSGELIYSKKIIALNEFSNIFDPYYLNFVEYNEGLNFESNAAKLLISEELKQKIIDLNSDAGNFKYFSQMHFNFG